MVHYQTELAAAMGSFYARWRYDHFAVLTFDFEVDGDFALRETQKWIRRVERLGAGKAWYLATAEVGDEGRVHAHVLTANTAILPEALMSKVWHLGGTKIERCRDSVRAAHYVMKYAGTARLLDYRDGLPLLSQSDVDVA